MNTDTRADVLDLVSTLAEDGWSIDERREAAAMLRRLLNRAEKAEAANQARPDYNLYCENCGRAHILDTSIPSEIWNLIAPQNSILCTTCIDDKLFNAGLECEAEFYFVGEALRGKLYSDALAGDKEAG